MAMVKPTPKGTGEADDGTEDKGGPKAKENGDDDIVVSGEGGCSQGDGGS